MGCNVKEGNLLDKSPFDTKRDVKIGGNYEIYFTEDTVFIIYRIPTIPAIPVVQHY